MTETQNANIQFELVSPEEKLVSEPVYHAVLPGEEGEFGVGGGHTALVVALQPGVVKLYAAKDSAPRKIFITGGFADVTGVNCTVLAEDAVNVDALNQADIEKEIAALESDLANAAEGVEKARATRRLVMAKAKLQAVTGRIAA